MNEILEKNSSAVRKRIEAHTFTDEEGEEYEASTFGGLGDYFRRKRIKLQNLDAEIRAQSSASGKKPQIFKGLAIHITGYTQPPLHILHREIVLHGGGFLQYLDSKTMATHIVTSALPPKKQLDLTRYKVASPQWIIESIAQGKLLPWYNYRLVDTTSTKQKTILFEAGKMTSQAKTPVSRSYKNQDAYSFYSQQLKQSAGSIGGTSMAQKPHLNMESPLYSMETITTNAKNARNTSDSAPLPNHLDQVEMEITITTPSKHHETPFEDSFRSKNPTTPVKNFKASCLPLPSFQKPRQSAKKTAAQHLSRETCLETSQTESRVKLPHKITSEEHNAHLLSDPQIRQQSCANPNFLQQFYSESRLHHLSTWKADLKSRMHRMANEKRSSGLQGKSPPKRKPGSRRYIMHVDFDSFFCAVSLKSAPEYVDKPTVVAHGNGTGSEIASCNYPARKHGVRNGMWMKRALELCPDIKVLPYNFPAYENASKQFYEAILDIGGVVQSVSVDEALVDITEIAVKAGGSDGVSDDKEAIRKEQAECDRIARGLRDEIKHRTACNVSVGIGGNILQAKVALRRAKPAGQYQLMPNEVQDFIDGLQVEQLPGIAYSLGGRLEELGVKTVRDLRQITKERLSSHLGPKTGEKLYEYARGIDKVDVGDQPSRKSISAEVNWGIRFTNQKEAEEFVFNLAREMERRLLNEGVKGRNLTMKLMRRSANAPLDPTKHLGHGKCDTFNKSVALSVATNNRDVIGREAVSIMRSFNFSPGDLRGVGIQVTKLEQIKPMSANVPDGSQKRLNFAPTKETNKAVCIGVMDIKNTELESARRGPNHTELDPDLFTVNNPVLTPKKPKAGEAPLPAMAVALAAEKDKLAQTPLNLAGTQFLLPDEPDQEVLSALPPAMRSAIMAQSAAKAKEKCKDNATVCGTSPFTIAVETGKKSQINSPVLSLARASAATAPQPQLPPDLDPEVFHALPEDVKAEVIASYGITYAPGKVREPSEGIESMGKRMISHTNDGFSDAEIAHANYAASRSGKSSGFGDTPPDIDPDLLASLPVGLREEVLRDHKEYINSLNPDDKNASLSLSRQKCKPGTSVSNPFMLASAQRRFQGKPRARAENAEVSPELVTVQFPQPPLELDFGAGLKSQQDLKLMLITWYKATLRPTFSSFSSEKGCEKNRKMNNMRNSLGGPNAKDVMYFATYLKRVVKEERDLAKAIGLVKWLLWIIESGPQEAVDHPSRKHEITELRVEQAYLKQAWKDAIDNFKEAINTGARERGLGRVQF